MVRFAFAMNIRLPFTAAFQIGFAAIVVCLAAPGGFAQSAATGIVEGRVLSGRSGEYLESARLTVEGTSLEAFTDAEGLIG